MTLPINPNRRSGPRQYHPPNQQRPMQAMRSPKTKQAPARTYAVTDVAARCHLSVRALHHYDAIGLLRPSRRSAANYRLYDDQDLQRLQQILIYRELGLSLDAVAALLDAEPAAREHVLRTQRAALLAQQERLQAMLQMVDANLKAIKEHQTMNPDTLFQGTQTFREGEYAAEAEQRWGKTDAWQESKKRQQNRTSEDRDRMLAEADANVAEFVTALRAGQPATGAVAINLARQHRAHIERWHYPCPPAMHVQLADMYVHDPRFTAHYDQHAPGLAAYIAEAIRAASASG